MKILVVGGGGREHALAWKIAQSPLVSKVYCAPGNAGIAAVADCIDIKSDNLQGLVEFATANSIDLTVVGPEAPLIAGIVDLFEAAGLPVFGPSREPAQLEGSKVFSKNLMKAAGIPTAEFWAVSSAAEAKACVAAYFMSHPESSKIVLKADGIAAGKGVIVASGEAEAIAGIDRIMIARVFGSAGDQLVIEECLEGEEASIMAITDGSYIVPLLPSQDHKRAFDGDLGSNTGGMGAYCPVPIIPQSTVQITVEQIIRPAVMAIRELGIPYRGVVYAGVMVTSTGPKCIEFNCRLGDPETQTILPMLESDIVPLLMSVVEGTLDQMELTWRAGSAVCVVAASEGYPDAFDPGSDISQILGRNIEGLDTTMPDSVVFHSGTKSLNGNIVTSGGRVLAVTGMGSDLISAAANAYLAMDKIQFDGMHYRKDIAARALHEVN